jgi:hypothetical protein
MVEMVPLIDNLPAAATVCTHLCKELKMNTEQRLTISDLRDENLQSEIVTH